MILLYRSCLSIKCERSTLNYFTLYSFWLATLVQSECVSLGVVSANKHMCPVLQYPTSSQVTNGYAVYKLSKSKQEWNFQSLPTEKQEQQVSYLELISANIRRLQTNGVTNQFPLPEGYFIGVTIPSVFYLVLSTILTWMKVSPVHK